LLPCLRTSRTGFHEGLEIISCLNITVETIFGNTRPKIALEKFVLLFFLAVSIFHEFLEATNRKLISALVLRLASR